MSDDFNEYPKHVEPHPSHIIRVGISGHPTTQEFKDMTVGPGGGQGYCDCAGSGRGSPRAGSAAVRSGLERRLSVLMGHATLEAVIVGVKRELKATREKMRELRAQNVRWCSVAHTLRKLAGLDEAKFNNLLQSESLPLE